MYRNTFRLKCGIIVRVEAKGFDHYSISGSSGKYAFLATVYDKNKTSGVMGSRIVYIEVWRAKKLITGSIKIFPVFRCNEGRWTIKARTKKDHKALGALTYDLNAFLPQTFKIAS